MRPDSFNPVADRKVLIFIAGFMWLCTGIMLISLAVHWLSRGSIEQESFFLSAGFIAAVPIHHFGFRKIVNKNLSRLLPLTDKKSIFSFMPLKSYLIIPIMATMGFAIRHSGIPKQYISIIYSGIGLALFLSGLRYLRFCVLLYLKKEIGQLA
jgi:hypothetical protein